MQLNFGVSCPVGTYKCRIGEFCISVINLCDGYFDCPDSEDEKNCQDTLKFTCNTGQILSVKTVCNFFKDCPDGSDEEFCGITYFHLEKNILINFFFKK